MVAAIFVALLATNSFATSNLNLSKSNINRVKEFPAGAVTTASVNLGPGESAIVYNTPTSGDFILTQFCASPDAPGGIRLDATGLGGIAQTGTTSCFTFTPGVSIPKGSTLSCTTFAPVVGASSAALVVTSSYFCTISGMQTAK